MGNAPAHGPGRGTCPKQTRIRKHRGRDILVACKKFAFLVLLSALLSACSPSAVERVEWTTMGTVAALQTRGAQATEYAQSGRKTAQRLFEGIAKLLNAHDPDSELSRLAALTEPEILAQCDPSVSNCYATAFRLMHASGGAFNPRWRGPKTLDLGAIAKGFAVDVASGLEIGNGRGEAVLLDLGGNLKSIRGEWKVGIAGSDVILTLTNGMACATSAEYYRGKHIYDGRTGQAVSNGVTSVTVVHPTSAMLADGLSTTLFVFGKEEGERFLKANFPEARAYWR